MEHGKVTADPVGSRVAMEGVDPGCHGDGSRCSAGKNGGAYVLVGGHVDILSVCVERGGLCEAERLAKIATGEDGSRY